MSKSRLSLKTFSCPCGWTLTTPTGEDDIVKHVNMHFKDFHKDMKTKREDIVKKIKNV